jgi:hypothetical protein
MNGGVSSVGTVGEMVIGGTIDCALAFAEVRMLATPTSPTRAKKRTSYGTCYPSKCCSFDPPNAAVGVAIAGYVWNFLA